jgi:serine/threonine-protein kinase HipA
VITVFYNGLQEKLKVGRLAYKEHKIFFEYSSEFLKTGLELSPYKLPLQPGVFKCTDDIFEGLFGVFNDSLPDGWGRLLLDRKLKAGGQDPGALTPLDRLRFVGSRGMGALSYEPEIGQMPLKETQDLDLIADETLSIQEQNDGQFVDDLLAMNGSSAGARPKILVSVADHSFMATDNQEKSHKHDWLIKFRSSIDPKDVGPIEYAYHLMAKACGLDVPEARLFPSKKCPGYFGVKRFDRTSSHLLHMHTLSGFLHADYRYPSLDYEFVIKATMWLTKNGKECEKQFRNAVFNVFSYNRDDHARNFSFLMHGDGTWKVSPAYDLTFSSGLGGEHSTAVMREGKNPKPEHLLKLADAVGIAREVALKIIAEVKDGVLEWVNLAKQAHVSKDSREWIHKFLKI